jgi:hypothetical protein
VHSRRIQYFVHLHLGTLSDRYPKQRRRGGFNGWLESGYVTLRLKIGRLGSGASSYIAILSDVTLPQTAMIIFAVFSLFAGVLVIFLPETQDQPLADTLQVL